MNWLKAEWNSKGTRTCVSEILIVLVVFGLFVTGIVAMET